MVAAVVSVVAADSGAPLSQETRRAMRRGNVRAVRLRARSISIEASIPVVNATRHTLGAARAFRDHPRAQANRIDQVRKCGGLVTWRAC
ncbi:hypothetical protein GCM10022245_23710 [Streptomyces mayteni]